MVAFEQLLWTLAVLVGCTTAQCYYPNGEPNRINYQPCGNATTGHSMCCSTKDDSTPDTCRDDGLCDNGQQLWREGCSDSTWQSDGCLDLCITGSESVWPAPRDAPVPLNATHVLITTCEDGSFCCGGPNSAFARSCCANGQGVRIVDGKVVAAKSQSTSLSTSTVAPSMATTFPKSSAASNSPSSATSGSPLPSDSTTVPAPSSTPPPAADQPGNSTVSTATIAGAVVGGLAGLICILAGVLYMLRRKKNARPKLESPASELHGDAGFSGKPVYYAMELGSPDPVELGAEEVRPNKAEARSELETTHPINRP